MKLKNNNFWNMDENKHWHNCSGNNVKSDEDKHTLNEDNICTVCGYNGNLVYTLLVDGESYSVKASKEAKGNIVIPASYNDKPITRIEDSAFSNCANITSVVIPDGVISIENRAFEGCSNLVSIVIPSSVKSIGDKAFSCCVRLVEVINKSQLEIIKGSEDNGQVALMTLNVKTRGESEIVNVNDYLFYIVDGINYLVGYVGNEKSLVLPDSYKGEDYIIHDSAFYHCSRLLSVEIPCSVTNIGEWAFCDCSNLIRIVIGKNVTNIGKYAFSMCFKLIEVINKSTLDITLGRKDNGFAAYYALNVKTEFESDIVNVNDYLFYTAGDTNYLVGYVGKDNSLVLPDNYNEKSYEIYSHAFTECLDLRSVIIPDNVKSIGYGTFHNCTNLQSIIIGKGIINIGAYAFHGCSTLINVIIPNNCINIGSNAFSDCNSLMNIVIPNSVTSIGNKAFYRCLNLTSVIISSSVVSIGKCTFQRCSNLRSVVILNSVENIDWSVFKSCYNLQTVYYLGTPDEWNHYKISNPKNDLIKATTCYYSESKPTDNTYKYWNYVDGNPTKW